MGELRTIARQPDGPEWRRIIDVASPAVNTSAHIRPEQGKCWRVLSVATLVHVAAAVANRAIRLTHLDASGSVLETFPCPTVLTSGQSTELSWSAGLAIANVVAGTDGSLPLGTMCYLFPGEELRLSGVNNAADQFQKIRAVVIETYIGEAVAERNREQAIYDHWSALHNLITLGEP